MWFIWFLGGFVFVVIGVVVAGGAMLPRDHVATGSIVLSQPRDSVWTAIRDVGEHPRWRRSVSGIDGIDGPSDAPQRWTERNGRDGLRLVVEEADPGRMLRTRIDDDKLPFGGMWTIELSDEAGGTRVRITERGFVKPPPFRFIAKFLIGHSATLRGYLTDLGKKYGESVQIQP